MEDRFLISFDNPIVVHHKVHGQHILPGLAYIDILYQLFREHGYQYTNLSLRNLSIYKPLIVTASSDVLLHIVCTKNEAGLWDIRINGFGQQDGVTLGDPVLYVTAEMDTTLVFAEDTIDINAIRQQSEGNTQLWDIYAHFTRNELVHTGLMQARGDIYKTGDALVMEVTPAHSAVQVSEKFMFNPILIDGSGVGCLGMILQQLEEEHLFLPLSFESFYATALLQQHCFTRFRHSSLIRKKELLYMTLEFFNTAGKKVGELKNFVCKLIRNKAPFLPAESMHTHQLSAHESLHVFLKNIIAKNLNKEAATVGINVSYYDLGLASSNMLEIIHLIKDKMNISLPPTLLFEYTTIAELSSYLLENYTVSAIAGDEKTAGKEQVIANHQDGGRSPLIPESTAIKPTDVAIIAVEGRYPGANNIAAFWENLKAGKDCITSVDRWNEAWYESVPATFNKKYCYWGGFIDDVDKFDPAFFNISPREAEIMDPMQRLFLEAVWNLFEGVGYTPEILRNKYNSKVGVYAGAMYQQYHQFNDDINKAAEASLYTFSAIANRVSYFFDLQGPSMAIDSMCSSSLSAIHIACESLINGSVQLAVAGGVNLSLHPLKYLGLTQLELVGSSAGSRSFSEGDGYLPAEGVGVVLLKPLSAAIADGDPILAVIKSTAVSHGGRSNGFSAPNPKAQVKLMEDNFSRAGIDPRSISYVEASANGSQLGDAIEISALNKFYGRFIKENNFCAIGSVKSTIGHAEAASGMSQLTKVLLQLQHQQFVPSIAGGIVNPDIDFSAGPFYLQKELAAWPRPVSDINGVLQELPRRATISSFAAGGSNAHVILEEYIHHTEVQAPAITEDVPVLMVFSAKDAEGLRAVVQQSADYITGKGTISLPDMAYTLQVAREAMPYRLAVIINDQQTLMEALGVYLSLADIKDCSYPLFAGNPAVYNPDEALHAAALRKGDAEQIARHWVRGGMVDWELLYKGANRKKLSLPTYPFKKSSYWMPGQISPAGNKVVATQRKQPFEIDKAQSRLQNAQQFIIHFLSQELSLPLVQLTIQKDLHELGVNSLIAVRLLRGVEKYFDIKVSFKSLLEYRTIAQLAAFVAGKDNDNVESAPLVQQDHDQQDQALIEALEMFREGVVDFEGIKDLIG